MFSEPLQTALGTRLLATSSWVTATPRWARSTPNGLETIGCAGFRIVTDFSTIFYANRRKELIQFVLDRIRLHDSLSHLALQHVATPLPQALHGDTRQHQRSLMDTMRENQNQHNLRKPPELAQNHSEDDSYFLMQLENEEEIDFDDEEQNTSPL